MIECLLRYLEGYVRILLSGNNVERFFNLINARGIHIWNIEKVDEGVFFCTSIKEIYRLKLILKKTGMKIHIKERYGLPFFLFSHRKRKVFFAGIFCSWILVYIMSLYIWNISYDGNLAHTDDELTKFLEGLNVDEGMKKGDVEPEVIEKALRNEYFDITWASVEIKGTKLVIHVRENDSQVMESDDEENSMEKGDIKCNRTAVVESIVTREGTPLVKAGDTVNPGDVLISGKYQIIGDDLSVIEERTVRADGDVVGRVVYDINEEIDRKYTKKTYTGNEYTINGVLCNGREIDFSVWFLNKDYKLYDVYSYDKQVAIGDSFYLPVYVKKHIFREYVLSEASYTDEELKARAERKNMYILKKIEENTIQILENNVKIEVGDKSCRIYGQIVVLEYIGSFGGTYE